MPSDSGSSQSPGATGLFTPIFTSDAVAAATSDEAYLRAMLDFEAALAAAGNDAGVVPAEVAEEIVRCCESLALDATELGRAARASGTPVVPMVAALRAALPEPAAGWAHHGATSQDVLDSAAMLVARRTTSIVLADLDGVADAAAGLARAHRNTLLAGRTLLQQALPITFSLKACGWLLATLEAADGLRRVRDERLALQFGGAAGTLASLRTAGPKVAAALADRLGLCQSLLPWHTDRTRVGELAAGLALVAGAVGKIALDVVLMAQTEVGEVREAGTEGRGVSSAMPHKRNPVVAVGALAAARRAQGLAGVLLGSTAHEHERAAGAWQAEWMTLVDLLRSAGGAASLARQLLEGLEVDPARMAANLGITHGLLMAERAVDHLAPTLGRSEARRVVDDAVAKSDLSGRPLADELAAAGALRGGDELAQIFDESSYTGSAEVFVERTLEHWQARRAGGGEQACT